ncbi:MAG: dihydroneopterin aldolase [Betaproteobacteria bacterium]|jgi:dihydroneopterin aldolase|nr:dihydroneopterin aldolase [Betaproteobacteria bacterium]
MNFIFIEGLRVDAWVGIYARERVAVQTVEFDLNFGIPEAATIHDDITGSIDYAKVIGVIRAELAERHFNLIETLGEFVADLLCARFSVPWVKVWVSKPGVVKEARRVGAYIQRGEQDTIAAVMPN